VELNGEYTFDAPRQVIWDALMDPDVLARILPGVEKLEKVSDTEFAGVMNVRVGPVQGKFKGTVTLTDLQEPEKFHMIVDGRGAAGFIKGEGDAILTETEDGKTLLTYDGSGDVGGKIASVGQRLVETTGKSIVRQGLESLDRLTQAQLHPPEVEGEEIVIEEYVPPSEFEVAKGVAKDVFQEYIPEERRVLVAVAGAALFIGVIFLLYKLLTGSED
jgi:carbon monoxide dehydrogenase subunit G